MIEIGFVLESTRLRLRQMSMSDLDFIAEMLADPEVMRYYPNRCSRQEAEGWIVRQLDRYRTTGYGLWIIEDRHISQPLGQAGLLFHDVDGERMREVGYLIHSPFWRNGFATEAATAIRDFAFETLKEPRVISLIRPENKGSLGVARKMGMKREGRTMRAGLAHDVYAAYRPGLRASTP